MKKRIVLLLLAVLMLVVLTVPALATEDPIETTAAEEEIIVTLSEDLQQAQVNGVTYVRFNSSYLTNWMSDITVEAELSETQKQSIKQAYVQTYESPVIRVEIDYLDGAELTVKYIREDMKARYEELLTTDSCEISFIYYDDDPNNVLFSLERARGKEEILFRKDIYYYSTFRVVAKDESGLTVSRGMLLKDGDVYYYVDYAELGSTDIYEQERTKAWQITDEALIADIEKGLDEYYGEDWGVLEDQDFSEQVSKVFLIILFMVIPGAMLILFFVLAIRAKTPVYKKLFWNLCAWSALVLIVAVTVVLVVQLN